MNNYKLTAEGGRILIKRSKKFYQNKIVHYKRFKASVYRMHVFNEYVHKPVILHVYGVLSILKQIFLGTLT